MGLQRAGHSSATKRQQHSALQSCVSFCCQSSDYQVCIHTHPCFFGFPFPLGHHNTLSSVACAVWGFPAGSESKASACNVGDPGSIPGSGRSPGKRNGYPLQYSCPENSMDRRAWQASMFGAHRLFSYHHLSCDSAPIAESLPFSAVQTTTMSVPNFKFMRSDWNGPCVSHTLTLNKERGQDVWSYHPNMTAGTLTHCWGECKTVRPLWRTVCKLLTKLNVLYPYNPGIMLLVIYPIFFPINPNFYPTNILHIIVPVRFSHSVVSNSLRPHGLQHSRLPCPSPTPRACSDSCPLSW